VALSEFILSDEIVHRKKKSPNAIRREFPRTLSMKKYFKIIKTVVFQ